MNDANQRLDPALEGETSPRRGLDRALVIGFAWTGAAKSATQVLSWLSTLLVARLLLPADLGLYGMAAVYLGFVQIVNQCGLGAAILQKRDLTSPEIAQLGGFSLLLASCLCAVSWILAGTIARFFGEPAVTTIVRVLSVTFIGGALEVVPRTLLTRDLEFRRLALIDSMAAIVMMVTTLWLALLGARYWSLIGGVLGGRFMGIALVCWIRRHPISWPRDFRGLRESLSFGAQIVGANVAWYLYRNADLTTVGRVLGKTALGTYELGITISGAPLERLNELVGRVVPSVFAAVQNDAGALRRYFLHLSEGLSLFTFPAAVGLAMVAEDFVALALGPRWQAAVLPLRLLALASAFRSLGPLVTHVMIYSGNPSRNTRYTLAAALTLPPLFWAGAQWGLAGVALVWLIGQPVVSIATAYRDAFRIMQLPVRSYLRALWPASSSAASMAASVALVRLALPHEGSLAWRFTTEVAAGVVTYLAALCAFHREQVVAFASILSNHARSSLGQSLAASVSL